VPTIATIDDFNLLDIRVGKIEREIINPSIGKIYCIIRALEIRSSEILPF